VSGRSKALLTPDIPAWAALFFNTRGGNHMAKLRDIYHYENPRFSPLRDAARRATAAYQNAARGLDTLKEWVLVEFGLVHTADAIHRLAHEQPKRFDVIGDILHQRHLMQEYPETPEYRERPEDMDGVFGEVIRLLEDIEDALRDCVGVSEEVGLYPLAREFENLQMENSKSYETMLYAWQMYDATESSGTSYDNWIEHLFSE
jgi:hypothetical protein